MKYTFLGKVYKGEVKTHCQDKNYRQQKELSQLSWLILDTLYSCCTNLLLLSKLFTFTYKNVTEPNKSGKHSSYARQLTRVDDCTLRRVGSLSFDLQYGSCAVGASQIVLCFSDSDYKRCYRSDDPFKFTTGEYSMVSRSNENHEEIRISSSSGNCLKSNLTVYAYLVKFTTRVNF